MASSHRSLNILHLLSSSGYYGAERWVVALANNLDRDEVNCELAVIYDESGPPAELVENFPAPRGDQHHIRQQLRFDPGVIIKLKSLIIRRSIDVINSHGYKSDLVALPAARLAGIRCVSTPHGFGSGLSWKMRMYLMLGTLSLRGFDKVVPLSTALFQQLKEEGIPEHRLALIENSVDLATIDSRHHGNDKKVAGATKRIGYVGRLVDGKQVDQIIRVFANLTKNLDDIELYIIGDGPNRASLEALAEELGCGNSVVFTGFVEEGLSLMKTLTLMVMASNSEGIPRCIMEAFALRVPVAAYNIPGVSDLIVDGESGRLAPLNDVAALSNCCRELLLNETAAADMANASRNYIEERFSAARMAREYTALYKELTRL